MKIRYILISLFTLLSIALYASEPLKIGVISDTHYLSEQLMVEGTAIEGYMQSSGRNIKYSPAILDKVLADYKDAAIDVLLVSGDITKDGEKQSHLDFVKKLKPLQDKGTRVFVIPGNHDINMPNSVGYLANETYLTDNVSPEQFAAIYKDCGYATALHRDTASLSYVAQLNESTWLLAIDAARYKEYTTSSISAGAISMQTEEWIVGILDEAKRKGIEVIGMMHWGLTEHIASQAILFEDYLVNDWVRLAALFADKGMKVIFTGHFHANDITMHTSPNANKIYDIETGALTAYPFSYRFVDLYKSHMDVSTRNIISIPQNKNLAEQSKMQMQVLAERMAMQKIDKMGS